MNVILKVNEPENVKTSVDIVKTHPPWLRCGKYKPTEPVEFAAENISVNCGDQPQEERKEGFF